MKKKTKLLIVVLVVSLAGNVAALWLLDKALHYREYVKYIESAFPNEGLRLVDSNDLRKANIANLGVFIGGGLPRFWFFPPDFPFHLANKSGREESVATTFERFDETVLAANASFVLINAGFCDIYVAIQQDKDIQATLEKNLEITKKMVEKARRQDVFPILSTLTPVRSRFLLPHLGLLDYSSKNKAAENGAYNQYNRMLADYCSEAHVPLIDFHKALLDEDGRLARKYSLPDGEHIRLAGYLHLTPFLAAELERIFADRDH